MRQKEHWKIVISIQKTVAGFYAVFYASVTTQELTSFSCCMLLANKTIERMLLIAEISVLLICKLSEFTGGVKGLEIKTPANIS